MYSTTGVYQPGSSTASYLKTTYSLFTGNSVTLSGTNISCTATPPSPSLPCATINADKVVTQLAYNSAGDLTSSATPDGNGSEIAKTTYTYDGDGEKTSETSPDGNLSGANAGNYTTTTAYNDDGEATTVTQAGGTGATATPRATTDGYDANGNKTTVQDARSYTATTAYNADDKPTLVTDPLGNATLTCYDGDGNATETVPPVGVAANSLTPASCPANYPPGTETGWPPTPRLTASTPNSNKTRQTTPAPAGQTGYETTTYIYDGDGHVIKTTAPPTSDARAPQPGHLRRLRRRRAARHPDHRVRHVRGLHDQLLLRPQRQHHCGDRPRREHLGDRGLRDVLPLGRLQPRHPTQAAFQTTYSYDSAGELVSTTSPATAAAPSGATTSFTYDPAGNIADHHRPQRRHHHLDLHPGWQRGERQLLRILSPLRQLHLRRQRTADRHDRCHRVPQLHLRPVRRADLSHQWRREYRRLRLRR